MSWWLIVRRDGVPHCWEIGDTADDARIRDVVDRARTLLGFPPGDSWTSDRQRNSVQLTCGTPHEQLMAEATVHQLSELDTVAADALAAYRAQCDVEHGRARVQAAREAMLQLTSAERTQLISELPPRPVLSGGKNG